VTEARHSTARRVELGAEVEEEGDVESKLCRLELREFGRAVEDAVRQAGFGRRPDVVVEEDVRRNEVGRVADSVATV